ncbi:Scr1 family TA system antitoxin-like transcriptional regulator [Actinomadura sp. 21ATH]|uniref:helix-turn-helix domain-containing protein n=1 Tax=Actinomadura sp. 21ATH TaxID=1735444 RepID=UPI0035C20771
MAPRRNKAKVSPTLLAFGRRFRKYREAKGWSQENVARRANDGQGVTPQYVGMIETGRTRCTLEFVQTMDREFGANGVLVDLWEDLVKDAAFPVWFDWPSIEETTEELVSYSLSLVHGLLQTPEYASVLLYGDQEAVEARMRRQDILTRRDPPPPGCTFLIDEGVLLREVGNPKIMREQLDHLVVASQGPVSVQVVPMRGDHLGNIGSFTIAYLDDLREVAYVESVARGFTMEDSEDLSTMRRALREIRSQALPTNMSIDLIRRTAEERWS